ASPGSSEPASVKPAHVDDSDEPPHKRPTKHPKEACPSWRGRSDMRSDQHVPHAPNAVARTADCPGPSRPNARTRYWIAWLDGGRVRCGAPSPGIISGG